MFSDFIKHYDNIRFILRDIFLYGCFTREDLEKKTSVSSRKISYEIRRIQQYIEGEFIKSDWEGRNKLLSLSYDSIENTKNFLVGTYEGKSFTKTDIKLYFYLIMIFRGRAGELSFADIEDLLIDSGAVSYDDISSRTIQRKLKELSEEMGLLRVRKEGRMKKYSSSEDVLEELSIDEIKKLYSVISLFKSIVFPTIAGHYCGDTIKDYFRFKNEEVANFDDHFQYRNLHFHPIIDEEIMWKIMKATRSGNEISFESIKRDKRKMKRRRMKPHKFRYDVNRGRMYLLGFDCEGICVSSRIDKIHDLKVHRERFNREKQGEKYKLAMDKSWSSVPCNHSQGLQEFKISFQYNEAKEGYLFEKVKMELDPEEIMKVGTGEYILERSVNDCWEMIPWIRSYAGNMTVLEPKWLKKKLDDDWKEMLKGYGVIS